MLLLSMVPLFFYTLSRYYLQYYSRHHHYLFLPLLTSILLSTSFLMRPPLIIFESGVPLFLFSFSFLLRSAFLISQTCRARVKEIHEKIAENKKNRSETTALVKDKEEDNILTVEDS